MSKPIPTRQEVEAALEQVVNPVLKKDGGYASLTALDGGIAIVRMEGMCAHCPNAEFSFAGIIRKELLAHVPGLREVRRDESEEEELLALARKFLSGEKPKGGSV